MRTSTIARDLSSKSRCSRSTKFTACIGAIIAIVAGIGSLVTANPAAAFAGPVFQVMNTSETPPDGVYFRNSPHTADTSRIYGLGVFAGDYVQLNCYAWGDAVGAYNDTLWYYANNVTRPTVPSTGGANVGYLNAHYINDGKAANVVDSGVPQCGTSGSSGGSSGGGAPAPAPVSFTVRGSVSCPGGLPVSGVYVHSSGGGSDFASWTAYPGASTMARYSRTFTTTLPSTIYFSVGCGSGSTSGSWKTSNNSGQATVSSGTVLYDNFTCNGSGTCVEFPMEDNTPAAPLNNPGSDPSQCTWRASDFWRLMTGRYPNWGGNAGYWDDNAQATGWSVVSWPRVNSLFVSQPTGSNKAGHVGYVADVRVSSGQLQMKIYDRNYDLRGTDRDGVWIAWTNSMRFIVPPARTGADL